MAEPAVENLVQQTLAGDRQACLDLVGRYGRGLVLVCMALTGPAEPGSVARQAWKQTLSRFDHRRRRRSFGSRLVEVASGLCRIKQAAKGPATAANGGPDGSGMPSDVAEGLYAMSEQPRLCAMLYYLDRQDAGRVAEMLDLPVPEVYDHLREALRYLEDPQSAEGPPGPCHRMQDRMIDRMLGILGQIESQAVRHHIEGCERCRRFHEGLGRWQERLAAAATQIDPVLQTQCAQLVEETRAMPVNHRAMQRRDGWPTWAWPAVAGVALVLIGLIGLGGWAAWRSRETPSGPGSSMAQDPAGSTGQPTGTGGVSDPTPPGDVAGSTAAPRIPRARPAGRDEEVATGDTVSPADALFAVGDAAGLIRLLDAEQEDTRVAAAHYLAEIGDRDALEPLLRAMATWTGESAENPYVAALKAILARIAVAQSPAGQAEDAQAGDAARGEDSRAGSETGTDQEMEGDVTEQDVEMDETIRVSQDPNDPTGFHVEVVDPNDPAGDPNEIERAEDGSDGQAYVPDGDF